MKRNSLGKAPGARSRLGSHVVALILITGSPAGNAALAQAAGGATPSRAELVAVEVGMLELIAAAPLTADEKQQIGEVIDRRRRDDPKGVLENYTAQIKGLRRAAKDSGTLAVVDWNTSSDLFDKEVHTQSVRQSDRMHAEAKQPTPDYEIEAAIVRRRDPAVVVDDRRSLIISEANLRLLEQASAWYAKKAGLPGPSEDFKDHLRFWIKANYLRLDADGAAAMAEEPQNFLYLTDSMKGPRHDEAAMEALRTRLQADAPPARDVLLAMAVSNASRAANASVQRALGGLKDTAARASGAIGYGTAVQQTQGALSHH